MNQIKLTIGGEERIFHFGLWFLGELLEKENMPIQEIGQKTVLNPYKWNPIIMYHSLASGYTINNEEPLFTKKDVVEWIEQAGGFDSEVFNKWQDAFVKSLTKDVPEDKEPKKKVTKK